MNITDFAVIAKLNSAETAALQDILSDKTIMAMAEVIAAERFRNYPAEGSEDFPENDMLAQAWFAAAYLSIGHSKEKFRQLGYPESVWRDTMSDMVLWLRNEQRNSGIIGLGPVAREWTAVLYNGDVLRFGRLECNAKYCFKGDDIFDAGNNLLLAQGSEVINLHIPEDGAMSMDLCSVSLKKMAGFFAEYRPEYHWQGFICQSWLLDSQLQTMLPENSNIIKFQNSGIHYPVDIEADTVFRIFGSQDPFKVKNPTTLQRKAAEFLQKGGVFREEGLFIPRSVIEDAGFDLEKLLLNQA